ncbi:hypothetical protein Tco_1459934 [Tanacetum coccineum]
MAEPTLKKYMENAQSESNPTEPNTDDDINIEFSKEFLMKLKDNAYHEMFDEDVVDHIAKVLELLDLIKIPGVNSDELETASQIQRDAITTKTKTASHDSSTASEHRTQPII